MLCTEEVQFTFEGDIYIQADGVSMGSPLASLLANVFMCELENKIIPKLTEHMTPWHRYVDDTFLLFWDESHVDLFQQYLNQQHNNIKFTVEKEENDCLPFLDVLVTRMDTEFITGTYRKPTFSGMYSDVV